MTPLTESQRRAIRRYGERLMSALQLYPVAPSECDQRIRNAGGSIATTLGLIPAPAPASTEKASP